MSTNAQIPVSLSAAQARSNFGQMIRRVSGKNKERFLIGLRGEPKAVVLGIEDYLDLVSPANRLMAEIDAEIAAYRAEQRALDAAAICHS